MQKRYREHKKREEPIQEKKEFVQDDSQFYSDSQLDYERRIRKNDSRAMHQ